MVRVVSGVALLAFVAGCPQEEPVECTDIAVASVQVGVTASDGGSLEGLEVVYSVDGGAAEPCEAVGESFVCGYEEDGVIEVTASLEGYEDAVGSVVVEPDADGCHVITEELELVLEKIDECPSEPVPAIVATIEQADGASVPDVVVQWAPSDDSAAPADCAEIDEKTFACAADVSGQLDLLVSATGFESQELAMIDVALDDVCDAPVTEEVTVTMVPSAS